MQKFDKKPSCKFLIQYRLNFPKLVKECHVFIIVSLTSYTCMFNLNMQIQFNMPDTCTLKNNDINYCKY